jgi:hypothetical protein
VSNTPGMRLAIIDEVNLLAMRIFFCSYLGLMKSGTHVR